MKRITKIIFNRFIMLGELHDDPFFAAVLTNNLKESFGRADDENRADLFEIVKYLYNEAPGGCWGSPEKVKSWIETGGLKGLGANVMNLEVE